MEGPFFHTLNHQVHQGCSHPQVLARSSLEDKMILVETLRDLGEIAGITGDGTNDSVAKEASDSLP